VGIEEGLLSWSDVREVLNIVGESAAHCLMGVLTLPKASQMF